MKQKNQRPFQFPVDTNPIEAVRDGVVQSVVNDLGKGAVSDLWKQILGSEGPQKTSGEMKQGQELDLASLAKKQNEKKPQAVEAGINYAAEIIHAEKRTTQEETHMMQAQIEQIVVELTRLTKSSKILEAEFREVVVEQRIEKPGKYHVSFFEWMLSVVKSARMKVEDGGAWLTLFKNKKKQRGYWQMFKKHGTSFGLSNERVVSTQTG